MREQQRPKWFHVHLLTGIALAVVAAALVWANFNGQPQSIAGQKFNFKAGEEVVSLRYGWPFPTLVDTHYATYVPAGPSIRYLQTFPKSHTIGNILITITLLAAVWFMCEWWIRRRAARRGAR